MGRVECVQLLLQHKADTEVKNIYGETPLCYTLGKEEAQICYFSGGKTMRGTRANDFPSPDPI